MWVEGWSNVILDPTLALIRAQLGFRIQVRAECGNIPQSMCYHWKLIELLMNAQAENILLTFSKSLFCCPFHSGIDSEANNTEEKAIEHA